METEFLTLEAAYSFIHDCENKEIFVYGIERFLVDESGFVPDLNGIADFSSLSKSQVSSSLAYSKKFLDSFDYNEKQRFRIIF